MKGVSRQSLVRILKVIAKLKIWRRLRNMTLGAAWAFITVNVLPKLPMEPLGPEASKVWMYPLWLAVTITNKDKRAKLKKYWERFRSEQAINSSWTKMYTEGRFATCNCRGCRRGKAAVRRLLIKTYLIAYCVRCRRKVSIKNPHQVVFANRREAIGGICPACGTKVFRIGKFYGKKLFEN